VSYGVCNANAPLKGRNLRLGPPLPARDAAIRQAPRYACALRVSNVRGTDFVLARLLLANIGATTGVVALVMGAFMFERRLGRRG
jgi:hypothetical protein